ncbi:MAG: threonine--tRNA ligase [Antricoccus sp.]
MSPALAVASMPLRVQIPAGTSAQTAVNAAELAQKGAEAIVVVREADGHLRDLAWIPEADVDVEAIAANTAAGRTVIRHSTAHILAQAVQQVFPAAKLGIGPPVTDGFYYDFAVDEPFTPDDLTKLEAAMKKIIKSGQRFSRRTFSSLDEAKNELAGEPFKLELIDVKGAGTSADVDLAEVMEVGDGDLTIYDNIGMRDGERAWGDLCRGPHVPSTRYLAAYKLTRVAAAYWKGSEDNPQLQRIYGTAWESKEALEAYLYRLEEAEKRDHRRLGLELDLFSFPEEIGSGLPVFHPKGGVLKREMEDYVRRRHIEEGFEYVGTPHISKEQLFHTSGHLPYYADSMFAPFKVDEIDYRLKAMNCPMHNLIFKSRGRSYRELPLRLFEFGHVYRAEKSGVVHGLTRVRGFAQDDSHSYVTAAQAPDEIRHLLKFVLGLLRDFGMSDFYLELSTRDEDGAKKDKFIGSDEQWQIATQVLADVCSETGLELVPDPGGAAYYGPKVSVQVRDAIGRSWQMSTIQYDFNMPERFGLEYQAADGTRQQPVMIHSAKFGSIERFFGVLVEHYAGAFPVWMSPVQVLGIPISAEQDDYIDAVAAKLRAAGLRVEVDHSDDRMQKKVRNAQLQKTPFMLLAGSKDTEADAVSFRFRDGSQLNAIPIDDAVGLIERWTAVRRNDSPTAQVVAEMIAG